MVGWFRQHFAPKLAPFNNSANTFSILNFSKMYFSNVIL